jgi:truncated hemoglobin YjbI
MAHRIISGASLMTVLLSMTYFPAVATISGGTPDAVSNTTIPLPAGNYATLNLLGAAVNGNQPDQTFVVTYTDGTTTRFTQSLSDWWGSPKKYTGESQVLKMPYLITPTGATLNHLVYVYGYTFAINSSKTVKSITLPKNRNVVVLAIDVGASGATPVRVNLAAVDNVVGIVSNGTAATHGGWDNEGYAYSASLLNSSITSAGSTLALGAAGTVDAVSNTTIPLPAGNYATLNLLGAAVNGNQPDQTFVVTYTDGTTTRFTQSLSDWWGSPKKYTGESQVLKMPYLITPTGATLNHLVYVYGYTFAINSSKTVKSITLPKNRNVVVLAIDVGASGATPVRVNLAAVDNVVGIVSNGTAATHGGWDNEGYAYSAGLLNSSITWAGSTFTLGGPGSTAPPIAARPVAQTLQISGTPATTAEVGQFYSFTPTVVASAGSSLTYAVANKPAWTQFSTATGALSGTPSTGSAATDANIVVSVSNGAQSAALPAFKITVQPALVTPAVAGTASLSWSQTTENTDGSRLTNLAGYVVRYGTSSTALNTQISVPSASATGVEITNLSPGNWYFGVAAINTANVESQFSAIVGKTIQ